MHTPSRTTHHASHIGFTTEPFDPEPAAAALPAPIARHPWAINLYLIVTVSIAAALLLCVLGAILLAVFAIPIPELLGTVAMSALVALAALLRAES